MKSPSEYAELAEAALDDTETFLVGGTGYEQLIRSAGVYAILALAAAVAESGPR